jgi:hypothetical protein
MLSLYDWKHSACPPGRYPMQRHHAGSERNWSDTQPSRIILIMALCERSTFIQRLSITLSARDTTARSKFGEKILRNATCKGSSRLWSLCQKRSARWTCRARGDGVVERCVNVQFIMSEQHHDQLARGFCDTSSVQTRANNPSCVSYASAEIRRRARSLAGSDTLLHQVRCPWR